jgi:hypothetical protein
LPCHPTKYAAEPSQLLPRGGGAFLAEIDGNLTRLEGRGPARGPGDKMRGPGFEPISFRLEPVICPQLVDSKGRPVSTVRAVAISEAEEKAEAARSRPDEDALLGVMQTTSDLSIADMARELGWVSGRGEPQKSKVHRTDEARRAVSISSRSSGTEWGGSFHRSTGVRRPEEP